MEVHDRLKAAASKMEEIGAHAHAQLKTIQVHKITPESIGSLKVNQYNTLVPIFQVARVSPMGAQSLAVDPFDKSTLSVIEKTIREQPANYQLRSNNAGGIVVSLPPLTEERRMKYVKQVQKLAEQEKIQIRNERNEARKDLKRLQNDGVSEDEIKKAEDKLQKTTDKHVNEIDVMCKNKEKSLMQV